MAQPKFWEKKVTYLPVPLVFSRVLQTTEGNRNSHGESASGGSHINGEIKGKQE